MRRDATITIKREGRDKGGVFVIKEMPAFQGNEWFARAMQMLVRSGVDLPPDVMQHGAMGFVTLSIGSIMGGLGKAPWHDLKPMLDELLTCVQSYIPPGGTIALTDWRVMLTQIEEPTTFFQLYEEVLSLHLGFSVAAKLLTFRSMVADMIGGIGLNTATSTTPSAQ